MSNINLPPRHARKVEPEGDFIGPEQAMLITPELAEEWLKNNKVNRNLRPLRVDLYAKQMASDHWYLTGETIVFDHLGNLTQGQHRLSACVKAGVPFRSFVIYGVDPEAMRVMDSGAARTASDMFKLEGIARGAELSTAVKYLIGIETGVLRDSAKMSLITRDELLDFYRSNESVLIDANRFGDKVYQSLRHSRSAWTALAFMLIRAEGGELTYGFLEGLASGADMKVGDPRLALRTYCLNRSVNRQRIEWQEQVANGIKTWNGWLNDKQVGHVKGWRASQPFPEIEV